MSDDAPRYRYARVTELGAFNLAKYLQPGQVLEIKLGPCHPKPLPPSVQGPVEPPYTVERSSGFAVSYLVPPTHVAIRNGPPWRNTHLAAVTEAWDWETRMTQRTRAGMRKELGA